MQGEGGLHGVSRRGVKERCSYFESHKESQLYWGNLWIKEWRIPSFYCDTFMSRTIKRQDTLNLAFILLGQSPLRAVCLVSAASVRVWMKAITQTLQTSWCLHFWVSCFFNSTRFVFGVFVFLFCFFISRSGKVCIMETSVWKNICFQDTLTLLYFFKT